MTQIISKLAALVLVLASTMADADSIREKSTVVIDGKKETWTLKWLGAQSTSDCGPQEPLLAMTCPCSGFAYSESGHLSLVREAPGERPEALALDDLFMSMPWGMPTDEHLPILVRWPWYEGDSSRTDADSSLPAEIVRRPPVRVMQFADYNQDGKPAEFLLQVGAMPCGKHYMVAVGVVGANGRLDVIRTRERPKAPLVLPEHAWKALLRGGRQTVLEWDCDDHGSEVHQVLHLQAKAGQVTAERWDYVCPHDPAHPKVKEIEKL